MNGWKLLPGYADELRPLALHPAGVKHEVEKGAVDGKGHVLIGVIHGWVSLSDGPEPILV